MIVMFEKGKKGNPVVFINSKISFPFKGQKSVKIGEIWEVEVFEKEKFNLLRLIEMSKVCICDYPQGSRVTVEQREAAEGHFNQADGYCCPHHGNTCGHCHQHDC